MLKDRRQRSSPLSVVRNISVEEESAGSSREDAFLDWSICMARAQAGDAAAYRRLLREISPYLRALAIKHIRVQADIEDVIQETLTTIHTVRHTYDPLRPFAPWLVAIARRRIVDGLRRQGRRESREVPLDDEHETFAAPATNFQEMASDSRALKEALDGLPNSQREAIRMLKLEELSLKEASLASGMSIAALKVATHRGLNNLRKVFSAKERKE